MHQVYTSKGLTKYRTSVDPLVYAGMTTIVGRVQIKPARNRGSSRGLHASSSSGSFGLLATVSPSSGGTVP